MVQGCRGTLSAGNAIPVDDSTVFETGSLTKPVMALLFSVLNERKEISLEQPVSRFFKKGMVHPIFDIIIIKDIITHTSGLPRLPALFLQKMTNAGDPYASLQKHDLYDYLRHPSEINKPGKYQYSNLGYGLLGEILVTHFNTPLFSLANELVLNPLGMLRTKPVEQFAGDANMATGHTIKNTGTPYWHDDVLAGAGFLLSCNNDMGKFLQAQMFPASYSMGNAILNTHELMTRRTTLGWHFKKGFLAQLLRYSGYLWHNGMTGGFASFMAFNKKKGTGFTLLANKAILPDSYFYRFVSYF